MRIGVALLASFFVLSYRPLLAQRVFLTSIDGESRMYALTAKNDERSNLPLIIILHDGKSNYASLYGSESTWKNLAGPAIIVFPFVSKGQWGCEEGKALTDDVIFLQQLIQESYDNFHIDRNKVYLVSQGSSNCLTGKFLTAAPHLIASTRHLDITSSPAEALTTANALITQEGASATTPVFEKWKNPLYNDEVHREYVSDSLKRTTWDGRVTVEFRSGFFVMLPTVKTSRDKTYMDLTDAHRTIGIHITSWMSDSTAWFTDLSSLKIPQKQEVDGARIEAGGGMVLPVTFGLRYTFFRHRARPYILLGAGPMPVMVFGGRFSLNTDPKQIKNKIEAEARFAFQTTIGMGMDWRMGKRIFVGSHLRYIHSSQFESAGSVNAIRGFNLNLSAGYILNANREVQKRNHKY